jgi:hypothetical protein
MKFHILYMIVPLLNVLSQSLFGQANANKHFEHLVISPPETVAVQYGARQHFKSSEELRFTLDSSYIYKFKTSNDSSLFYKTYFEFDVNGYLSKSTQYSFDTTLRTWFVSYKREFTWDEKGTMLSSAYFYRNTINVLTTGDKDDYKYNSVGETILHNRYQWADSVQLWIKKVTDSAVFSDNNKRLSLTNKVLDNATGKWYTYYHIDETYNSQGNKDLSVTYMADGPAHVLTGNSKQEYSYNGDNLPITQIYSIWDKAGNKWITNSKWEKTYNAEKLQILELSYQWDTIN